MSEREDLLRANALLHALVANRDAEIARLRKGIQDCIDGKYGNQGQTCAHGRFSYEICDSCIDKHLQGVLDGGKPE